MNPFDHHVFVRIAALELGAVPVLHSLTTNTEDLSLDEELNLLTLLLGLADKTWSPTLRNHKQELQQRARELHGLLSDTPPTSAHLYQAASELANEGKEISPERLVARVEDIRKREQFDRKMKRKASAVEPLVNPKPLS